MNNLTHPIARVDFEQLLDVLVERVAERVAAKVHAGPAPAEFYSQRELPPGTSVAKFLRVCREDGDELGVLCDGKTRLVRREAWATRLASPKTKNTKTLRLVPAGRESSTQHDAESVRAELGLQRRSAR